MSQLIADADSETHENFDPRVRTSAFARFDHFQKHYVNRLMQDMSREEKGQVSQVM